MNKMPIQTNLKNINIFISYAKEDYNVASKIYDDLTDNGLSPWMDKHDLIPGQDWKSEIYKKIKDSEFFIALLSSNSISKRGFVQKELKIAIDLFDEFPIGNTFIIPVRVNECKVTHERIESLHYVNLFPSYEEGLKQILKVFSKKYEINFKDEYPTINISIDARNHSVCGRIEKLASTIRENENVPGEYTPKHIVIEFINGTSKYHNEIKMGIQLLMNSEPLTFGCRNSYSLANCISKYVNLYNENNWRVEGTRIDLWRKFEPLWSTGIYVTSDEESKICEIIGVTSLFDLIGGFPNDMLDLGMSVLCNKAVPKLLFELFRRENVESKNIYDKANELLALNNWTFGLG